ncbi:hypothetical protein [Bathymodiolus japonicus methanotrophic gill symbiont]|uniref:hypothetical protein n=1 Tax=Bathymodiolus japonicus methanotrophic gill symbiont TaxID=113269 RepID=UPI001C8EF85D|nr:hypothetical protein [Bathymodiolus japonicus methanotrophic gill symbiont]
MIVVGSHNLTGGGLWTNFESSAHIPVDMSNSKDIEMLSVQESYFKSLASLQDSIMPIVAKDDVEKLLKNGYIAKEVSQQVRSEKAAKEAENRERLFGNGVRAPFPHVGIQKKETAAAPSEALTGQVPVSRYDDNETIWFETRKLTGGSRNILDLSMRSLVDRGEPKGTAFDLGESGFMRGGVEFFGVPPTSTDIQKDITLNFEGVDYVGNTILFPSGNNANGTWRLQIKGVSSSDEKITDAFRSKGENHYLVKKVVTFTKVEDDYYSISVYPDSEIEDFVKASRILARNGSTRNAKRLGLL